MVKITIYSKDKSQIYTTKVTNEELANKAVNSLEMGMFAVVTDIKEDEKVVKLRS